MKVDYLIVGQGLAGSLLAWHLLERDRKILVVDRDDEISSSKVAAGLVTPISGQQFSLPDGIETTLNFAKQTYWNIEEALHQSFFHHTRIARLFKNENEVNKWKKRINDPDSLDRYTEYFSDLSIDSNLVSSDFGGIELKKGGWLNVPGFVEAIRIHLLERLAYAIGKVDSRSIEILPNGGVQWRNITAKSVIFCEGWKGADNHFFEKIPMNNARGDILRCRSQAMDQEKRILNRGGWILPLGGGGVFRAGSNYDHDFPDENPTEKGRQEIETKIRSLIKPEFEVISHQSAIRPIINRSRVFMGRHPEFPDIVYFNGLGSKGVTNAPSKTLDLVKHLLDQEPIDDSANIRKQFRFGI